MMFLPGTRKDRKNKTTTKPTPNKPPYIPNHPAAVTYFNFQQAFFLRLDSLSLDRLRLFVCKERIS
jgi:hypothetical protein